MIKALARADWYCGIVDKYCSTLKETLSELSGFGRTAMEIANGDTSSISGMNASFLGTIEETLRNFTYGKDGSGGLMAFFSSIAIAISLIFFLISILNLVTEDRFTPEFLVKFFARFVISFCVIIWSPTILKAIVDFGTEFATMAGNAAAEAAGKVGGTADEAFDIAGLETLIKNHEAYYYNDVTWPGYPTAGAVANGIKQGGAPWSWHESIRTATSVIISPVYAISLLASKKLGTMGQMGPAMGLSMEMVLLMFFRIVSLAITVAVIFIVLTRIMELYVRGAFLPVAAALMSDDGWRGSGGRYFRKLMSLATQNAVVLVIANVFGIMCNSAMKNIFISAITAQTHLTDSSGKIIGCTVDHKTLAEIAVCKACLNEIPAPINLPILKPMLLCIIICVAGLAMMFKAAGLVDDIWGAR